MTKSKFRPIAGTYSILCLWNPKFDTNVGTCIRSAAALGCSAVWLVGPRKPMKRDPRSVNRDLDIPVMHLADEDAFWTALPKQARVVPVELAHDATPLPQYNHPDRAVYVMGPEDGSLPRRLGKPVVIPSQGCLNLATAATVVLYDRLSKKPLVSAFRDSHYGEPLPQNIEAIV